MKEKNLINQLILVIVLISIFQFSLNAQSGSITAPIGTPQIPSDYVDPTIPDDPVFIFCSPDENGDSILGTLSVQGGYANCIYHWGLFDPDSASATYQQFIPFLTGANPTGPSSTLTDLWSGFYQVIIVANQGLPNETTTIKRAHVFINKSIVDFDPISPGCSPFTITGGMIDEVENFTIYDPPITPFIIDSMTTIEVCFWADHTFVSDLGFYMVSPLGKRIDLLPPNSAWDQGSLVTELDISSVSSCSPADWWTNCNSGNNVTNFCFSSTLPAGNNNYTACVCDMTTPLTGTYASCEGFNELYGDEATGNGWGVTIFDCFAADVGSLQRVTLSISGQSPTGPSNFFFDSGSINVSINDGACSSATATTYYLPSIISANQTITNTVTADWSCSPTTWDSNWGVQDFSLNPSPNINPQPTTTTEFCLTITDHLFDANGIEITSIIPCQPQKCHLFETLMSDPTIINPPTEVCSSSPPIQLTPMYYGGAWSSTCGSFDPASNTGCLTGGGLFFPENALLGPNFITYYWGGICYSDTTITINVVDAPQVNNTSLVCNSINTQYQICFDITGGNPGTYSITDLNGLPAPGTFTGNTWCSNWVPSPFGFYYFEITDINNCNPIIISGNIDCFCDTQSGIMPSGLIEGCAYDPITSIAESPGGVPSWTLDPNDGYEYYLHTNATNSLGSILGHNTTGTFLFNPSMTYGETYYISQVVGNNIGTPTSHIVDLTDLCLSVAAGTPVIWNESPIVNAGANAFQCGLTTTLNADTPIVGTGSWSCNSAANVIFSPSFNDPGATAIVPNFDTNQYGCQINTEYVFRWTVTNGPCEVFDDVSITFKPQPVAYAGPDQIVCGLETEMNAEYSLCGPMGVSTGIWSGTGQTLAQLDPHTAVNEFNPGQYTYIWTEWNDQCSSEDYVTVTYYEYPFNNAGDNDTVCGNNYTLTATSTMGVGMWTGSLYAIIADPTSPTTQVDMIFTPGQSEKVAVFTWTETNVACTVSDEVTIVFHKEPGAFAGLNDWTCGTEYNLNADIIGSEFATGTWSTNFNGASFNDYHDPNSIITIPNTGSFPGQPLSGSFGDSSWVTINFNWTMEYNNCIDVDELELTFYQIPVAYAGEDFEICGKTAQLETEYSIGASSGKWTMISGPSSSPPIFTDDTDPNTEIQVTQNGEYVFEWQEKNIHNQTCMTADQVIVYFVEIPNPYAGPDMIACGNEVTLDAVSYAEESFWISTSPILIVDEYNPNSFAVINNLVDPATYQLIWFESNQYNGLQCTGLDTVEVTFIPIPDITIIEIDSGDVELTFLGGFPPFELLWSNGATDFDLFNLPGGYYFASLTDSYGCETIDSIFVAFPVSIFDIPNNDNNSILYQNIPNPFKHETELSFYLNKKSMVKLSVYDIIGNEIDVVVFTELSLGKHSYTYKGNLPAGTYFYRLQTEDYSQTRKMVIARE